MDKGKLKAIAFLLGWGVPILLFSGLNTLSRLTLAVNGTVLSSKKVEMDWSNPHRYSTVYKLADSKNNALSLYSTNGSTSKLPRDIEVGVIISKKKWDLAYTLNGQHQEDFPKMIYYPMMILGAVITSIGIVLLMQQAVIVFRS